nr:MAG: ORF1 [TTV-like mini virus]
MARYWKTNYKRNYRRRNWFRTRRPRKTIRRRWWKPRRHFRRYKKVKRRRFRRKKLKLSLQVFQPKKIRKCKIIGTKCLIQGSPLRCNNNYIQWIYSKIPENHPGGGGWSLIVFSLETLFEDFQHIQNVWTESNNGLPLVRYLGCSIKFFQDAELDYVCIYDNSWPMVDTPYTHADSCPSRMLMRKNKIIIPSRKTQQNKKPYKKKFIKPPSQMTNNWYFQKDICKLPLLMLTTTGVSLTHPFCDPKATSNNITVKFLSPFIFQNPAWRNFPQTTGYSPKTAQHQHEDTSYNMYLWATTSQNNITTVTASNINTLQLIPLTNPLNYDLPQPIKSIENWENKPSNWGNPFNHHILDNDSYSIYITDMSPFDAKQMQTSPTKTYYFNKPSGPLIYTCRYNPDSDTGDDNMIYLINTSTGTNMNPSENTNLQLSGFPLYMLSWGWTDFIRKLKITINLDDNYIVAYKTKQFDIDLPTYIPIDQDFIDGYDPYIKHDHESLPTTPSAYSLTHWYLKLQFQQQTIEKICVSGPACPRMPYNHYMQCYCNYKFYFKFGGCPKTLKKALNPCLQSKWTTADNLYGRLEISNPNEPPQTQLFEWDWIDDYVKTESIQRIKEYTTTDGQTFSFSETASDPKPTKKVQEKSPTLQEEEKELLNQLIKLQQQRQHLQQLLLNKLTI